MGKPVKKSKMSYTESDDSHSSSSNSKLRKIKSKNLDTIQQKKQTEQSHDSSSSFDSDSDTSSVSVKKPNISKTKEVKKSKSSSEKNPKKTSTDNHSKWDSPERNHHHTNVQDKKRYSSHELPPSQNKEQAYSRSHGRNNLNNRQTRRDNLDRDREPFCDNRSKREHKKYDRNDRRNVTERECRQKEDKRDYMQRGEERNHREKRDEQDYRQRTNAFDERHRHERERSEDNKNSGNDKANDERRDKLRERPRYSRERWEDGGDKQRKTRRDSTYFRNSCNLSPRRNTRQQRSRSKDRYEGSQAWGKKSEGEKRHEKKPQQKEEPNFGLSGALIEDTNKINGVVVKYAEPPEARRPKRRWRLYPFKGETALPVLHIHRQSCFLVGRERKVVDLAVDHPSCSKQHAALQYRLVSFTRDDSSQGKRVRLYLIDLDSANGTFLNNEKIEPRKYYELLEKDVIKFGFSTREYVLLHENSQEDQEDDDVTVKKEEPED